MGRDTSVDHVVQESLSFIERPPVKIAPDSRAKVEESLLKWVLARKVKNANDPFTVVFELVTGNSPPVVRFFHGVWFVVLDVGEPRVRECAMGSRHPAFPEE